MNPAAPTLCSWGCAVSHGEQEFESFVERADPHVAPYPYQVAIASHGFPEVLHAPTGSGKTMAAVLPWIYRRLCHPDEDVRRATPRWLVFALPMRVLVEQTAGVIQGWIERLELQDRVGLHVVMGGEPLSADDWRLQPGREAIFVGTLDMLLSRALNRGYAEGRFSWPIDFGLFNNGCQWIFDEIQLMGSALPTSRQIEGLRRKLGTFLPCATMWMSATVEERWLETYDLPEVGRTLELGPDDRTPELEKRLEARKTVSSLDIDPKSERALAASLLDHHGPGTRTIAVLNTVKRAQALYRELEKLKPEAELVLLHSRFRPPDRRNRTQEALAGVDAEGGGRIVVCTQVVEAGVDLSSTILYTDAAPWSSIVQRAGRCNRYGEASDARLLWSSTAKATPYDQEDVEAAVEALVKLEGEAVTPSSLSSIQVRSRDPVHAVLRRRDLIGLFDTTPDLSGNDIDVSRFIRERDEIDAHVAWREAKPQTSNEAPTREELCPVAVGGLRELLGKQDRPEAWFYDHIDEAWSRLDAEDVRPGLIVVLRSQDGRYRSDRGWDPASKTRVELVEAQQQHPLGASNEGFGDDPVATGRRVTLLEHLANVETAAKELITEIGGSVSPGLRQALEVAARLHDVGKAHEVFQAAVTALWDEQERKVLVESGPWAKSGSRGRLDYRKHGRPHFRHELASALALLDAGSSALSDVEESELVVYLVGAHHGRVRLGIRSLPDEGSSSGDPERRVALGIRDGDALPAIDIPGGHLPVSRLDLSVMELGSLDGRPSWTEMALHLRDREDLGPFRLAFLEGLLRLADWRASARENEMQDGER